MGRKSKFEGMTDAEVQAEMDEIKKDDPTGFRMSKEYQQRFSCLNYRRKKRGEAQISMESQDKLDDFSDSEEEDSHTKLTKTVIIENTSSPTQVSTQKELSVDELRLLLKEKMELINRLSKMQDSLLDMNFKLINKLNK